MQLTNWFRWARASVPTQRTWTLNDPFVYVSAEDAITGYNLLENVLVLGGVGSGKTTATGYHLARAMLLANWAGCVLCVKNGEAQRWARLCAETGRSEDLVTFDASAQQTYNFIADEVQHAAGGAGLTENVVNLLEQSSEILGRFAGRLPGRQDEAFWQLASQRLLRNAIDLIRIATGTVTIPFLFEALNDAPTSPEQIRQPEWQHSVLGMAIEQGRGRCASEMERHDFERAVDYFTKEIATYSDKTRSCIFAKVYGVVDPLCRGLLRPLFNGGTTISPRRVLDEGKVVVIDLAVKEFLDIGALAQVIWKHQFQKAIERRGGNGRPAFLFMDEFQAVCSPRDMQFLATSRGSLCATVMMSQCISNIHAALGADESGKATAESILALAQTKFFHAQPDPVTNEWSANLIGRRKKRFYSTNCQFSQQAFDYRVGSFSSGMTQHLDYAIAPHEFAMLRKGGKVNGGITDFVVFQGGRRWRASGETFLRTSLRQGY